MPNPSAFDIIAPSSTVSYLSVLFNWQVSTGATSYVLQVSNSSNFSGLLVNTNVGDTTSHTIDITPNGSYYWRVIARNSSGDTVSTSVKTFITSPYIPILLSATNDDTAVGGGKITVQWSILGNNGITGYRVKWDNGVTTNTQDIVGAGTTSYAWTGLTNGTTYNFSVASLYGGSQVTSYSNYIYAIPSIFLPAVSGLTATYQVASNMLTLTWAKPVNSGNIAKYFVYYRNDSASDLWDGTGLRLGSLSNPVQNNKITVAVASDLSAPNSPSINIYGAPLDVPHWFAISAASSSNNEGDLTEMDGNITPHTIGTSFGGPKNVKLVVDHATKAMTIQWDEVIGS